MFTIALLPTAAALQPTTAPPLSQPFRSSSPLDELCLDGPAQNLPDATKAPAKRQRSGRNIRKRESAIRQIIERYGMRLEKLGKDSYQLINERLNAVSYLFDGVPLKAVERHFEETWAEKFG